MSGALWDAESMEFIFHRRIQKDLRSALVFYEEEGGPKLGDRFFAEAEQATMEVVKHPEGFHFIANGLRRVSLKSFPYHFVFEVIDREIRFLVLRHDKRHPDFGLRRRF
jgi:plasmid stabilization system protein ParE